MFGSQAKSASRMFLLITSPSALWTGDQEGTDGGRRLHLNVSVRASQL